MSRRTPLFLMTAWLGCSALPGPGGAFARDGGNFHGHDIRDERSHRQDDDYVTKEYDDIRRLRQRGDILPLEQILQRARRQRDGRVLETDLQREDGRYVYAVELVDDKGRVWELQLDAATGEVLKNRRED